MLSLVVILVRLPVILLALSVHECAHALIAYRFGDPTAKDMGRITLNPLPHLDPIGTIGLIIGFIGWGKPVPVDPRNFHDVRKGMLWVSAAGPISNILLAFTFGTIFRIIAPHFITEMNGSYYAHGLDVLNWKTYILFFTSLSILINLALACFNMIPLFPLDGAKVVEGLLPYQKAIRFSAFQRYGPTILIMLIALEFTDFLPIISIIFNLITGPLTYLASGYGLNIHIGLLNQLVQF